LEDICYVSYIGNDKGVIELVINTFSPINKMHSNKKSYTKFMETSGAVYIFLLRREIEIFF